MSEATGCHPRQNVLAMNHPTTEEQLDTLRRRLNSPSTPQAAKEAIERAIETITYRPRKRRKNLGLRR